MANRTTPLPPGLPTTTNTPTPSGARSTISLQNLQLPHGLLAPDVWGQAKEQPALVSLRVHLHGNGFDTAAHADRLDDSTMHYGTLAKNVRKACVPDLTPEELARRVDGAVEGLGRKEGGRFIVARAEVSIALPKASMSGEGVVLRHATAYDREGRVVAEEAGFEVSGVKVMTLIGVNAYERQRKQPLVARVEVRGLRRGRAGDWVFRLEEVLVQIIQDTAFETLETLAEHTVSQLRRHMLDSAFPGAQVLLRIEKPRAIAFADAPAVEVVRDVPFAQGQGAAASTTGLHAAPSIAAAVEASEAAEASNAASDILTPLQSLSVFKPYSNLPQPP